VETSRRYGSYRLLAEVLCDMGRVEEALQLLDEFRSEANAIAPASQRAAITLLEARCLRLAGRAEEAVDAARRGVQMVQASNDEQELMLALEELAACEEAVGDLKRALADALEVKGHMWAIHQRQTRQLVQQLWARVDLERDHRTLQTKASEATRSAEEDALTGIGNRRLLERFLEREEVRQSNLACIIADIDSFKEINDTFGHGVGDIVLCQVGRLIASKARSGQQVIRYGGDEFVVALPGVDVEAARGFAERLRLAVFELEWGLVARDLHVTVSLGVACGPAKSWRVAFAAADGRLLAAKRQGRNTVVVTTSIDSLTA
jgi:diguanylate cyclase (GGDEF)-like protein